MSNIKIDSGLKLLAGTIIEPEPPSLDTLRNHIFGLCLNDDLTGDNAEVIQGLVSAYIAMAQQEDEDEEMILVSDSDEWAAEKVYREYAIKGWRQAVGTHCSEATASRDDETVYESCPWYEFGEIVWPVQLIAEVGYLLGYKAGREAVAMSRYYEQEKHSA